MSETNHFNYQNSQNAFVNIQSKITGPQKIETNNNRADSSPPQPHQPLDGCVSSKISEPEIIPLGSPQGNKEPNAAAQALVINVDEYEGTERREGSEKDFKKVVDTLSYFNVSIYAPDTKGKFVSHKQIGLWIKEFQDKCNKETKASFLVLMGHGDAPGMFTDSLGVQQSLESTVFRRFNNENFKMMIGKPKLFFMNCCRGGVPTPAVPVDKPADGQMDNSGWVATITDMLIFWSTTPENMSNRNPDHGSIFINTLFGKLERCALWMQKEWKDKGIKETDDMMDILNEVKEKMLAEMNLRVTQTPNIDDRAFKVFTWLLDDFTYSNHKKSRY